VLGRRAHGELIEVALAEHDGATGGQARDECRIVGRDEALEDSRATRGRHAARAEHVLDRQRDAVEGAERCAGTVAPVRRGGGRAGVLGGDRDVRANLAV
jgi:hypothetical protein